MEPVAADVESFLGKQVDNSLAYGHLAGMTQMVRAYTRDRGFTNGQPGDDLARVIVSATARIVTNPAGTIEQTAGPFGSKLTVFNGWTLPELAVLNRYRKKAA